MIEPRDTTIKDIKQYVYFGEYDGCVIGQLSKHNVYVDSQIRHPKTPRIILYAKKGSYFLECHEKVTVRIRNRVKVSDLQALGQSMYGVYISFDENNTIQDVLDILKEIYLSYVFVKHTNKVNI